MSTSPAKDSPPPPAHETKRGRPSASVEKIHSMKARIADKARSLFMAEGYAAVSMRRIAAGIGCAPMSLYTYYPAKIDILRHLWAEVFDRLFCELFQIADRKLEPLEELLTVSRHYVQYWLEHPEHYRMVFMSEGVSQPQVSVFVEGDEVSQQFQLFFKLMAQTTNEDEIGVKRLGESLICALNGIAHCQITMSGHPWSPADQLVTTIVNGLAGPNSTGQQ
jgi:AcrR family transcriptional regulator